MDAGRMCFRKDQKATVHDCTNGWLPWLLHFFVYFCFVCLHLIKRMCGISLPVSRPCFTCFMFQVRLRAVFWVWDKCRCRFCGSGSMFFTTKICVGEATHYCGRVLLRSVVEALEEQQTRDRGVLKKQRGEERSEYASLYIASHRARHITHHTSHKTNTHTHTKNT